MSSSDEHRAAESQAGMFDLKYLYGLKKGCQKDVIDWCMEMNLIAKEYVCPTCGAKMILTNRYGSDGYSWVCRKFVVHAHHVRRTVRKGSWIPEILILTYLWAVAPSLYAEKLYSFEYKIYDFNASCGLTIPLKLA
ncbi:hypothetical protein AVEN_42136-1 [Araneus ventricosus]|uniref:Uncharacterized protein n=1 Tax=Araneus ventricosus TaxID=182803 RepID=A0A4Y2D289_ARAVE|nr:hypothetical protein AVEN_42136-1 [Araneus ventricosus]